MHSLQRPTSWVCGSQLSVYHALTCPCDGYTIARHNEFRYLLASAMRELSADVGTEPRLLPFEGEELTVGRTDNRSAEARVDIRAREFWTRQQDAFFWCAGYSPQGNCSVAFRSPEPIKVQVAGQETEILWEDHRYRSRQFYAPGIRNQRYVWTEGDTFSKIACCRSRGSPRNIVFHRGTAPQMKHLFLPP